MRNVFVGVWGRRNGIVVIGGGGMGSGVMGPGVTLPGSIVSWGDATGTTLLSNPEQRIINGRVCSKLTNNTLAIIPTGTVIAPDTSADLSGQPAVQGPNANRTIGICAEDSPIGGDLWISGLRIDQVNCDASPISRGNYLDTGPTAGLAHAHAAPGTETFGVALVDKGAGAGPVWFAYLNAEIF